MGAGGWVQRETRRLPKSATAGLRSEGFPRPDRGSLSPAPPAPGSGHPVLPLESEGLAGYPRSQSPGCLNSAGWGGIPGLTSSPRGQVWSSRPQEPVLGTQRARLCPAHGLVKGSVDLSWAHPKDVSQAHEPFWESFPVRPGLAFSLSSLQRVRGTQAAPLSPLCVEEGGLGALPDPGLI